MLANELVQRAPVFAGEPRGVAHVSTRLRQELLQVAALEVSQGLGFGALELQIDDWRSGARRSGARRSGARWSRWNGASRRSRRDPNLTTVTQQVLAQHQALELAHV